MIADAVTDEADSVMPSKELKTCFGPEFLEELAAGGPECDLVKFRFAEMEKIFVLIPLIISTYYHEN